MKIQLIQYEKKFAQKDGDIVVTQFSAPQALDEFDVNVIDLSCSKMWKTNGVSISSVECLNDLKSLSTMVSNRRKSIVLYVFPQNCDYLYHFDSYSKRYRINFQI